MTRDAFFPDQPWLDDKGVPINAHGGGVLSHGGRFYWFGEHKPPAGSEDEIIYRYTVDGVVHEKKFVGETSQVGVRCYSSSDLYHWKDEGVALANTDDPASDIVKGCIIERPKVIFNAATGKFVMWFHLELKGHGRRAARSGVAVADRPEGPYTFVHSVRPDAGVWPRNATPEMIAGLGEAERMAGTEFVGGPNPEVPRHNLVARDFTGGQMAKDMTLFVDDDSAAYHIFASEENSTLHISRLREDYLSHAGEWIRVFPHRWHEAPALCKHDGRYWMVSSGCTGWEPNTARLSVADSIWGPWTELGNPMVERGLNADTELLDAAGWKELGHPLLGGQPPKYALGAEWTFGGQSTFLLEVRPGAFIALFDIWRPTRPDEGGYMWLPMTFADGRFTIAWRDAWDLSVFDADP